MLDMAQHYGQGPIHLGDISLRQKISIKYLEQIIRPLKQAGFINSTRGPKGGHTLTKPPREISVGEVVSLLEGGARLIACVENPESCDRVDECLTRHLWIDAAQAMYDYLNGITFADLLGLTDVTCKEDEP
jgi:Rrf2 family protein